jgi:SOS-response transcriptional repressor LexA
MQYVTYRTAGIAPDTICHAMTETQHDRLKRLREQNGFRTAAALAKAIRMSEATYRSYENGTRPLTVQAARQIAPKVGVDWKDLMLGSEHSADEAELLEVKAATTPAVLPPSSRAEVVRAPANGAGAFGPKDLPIVGHVKGGLKDDALFFDNGTPVAYTYRPDDLRGVPEAYAVYVVGDSMSPRFKPGQLVFVNPSIPPRPGDDVVIQQTTQEVFIKELVRRTEKVIRTKQYNPGDTIDYPVGTVAAIHVVVFSKHIRT